MGSQYRGITLEWEVDCIELNVLSLMSRGRGEEI